jgi:glycosyltransferase involved in cell wall biosynthesis
MTKCCLSTVRIQDRAFLMDEEFTIICLSREELAGTFYYNSALVPISLAHITNVIFFEPPWNSLLSILKNPLGFFHELVRKKGTKNQRKFPKKLKAVKLFCIFPWGWQNAWLRRVNDLFLLLQIKWNIRFYPTSKRILLTYWRDSEKLAIKIAVTRRIYHCTDEIAGFPWPNEYAKNKAIAEEAKVAKMADVVLVTSPTLIGKMSIYNRKVRKLANDVVDFDLFSKAVGSDPPVELSKLPRPIIGYVGDLVPFKVDFALVHQMASILQKWSFVFIGPIRDDAVLPQTQNLFFLGPRIREEIPSYIAAFDVCIIPHNVNLYMKHSFPVKFFEYLSLGKPVVATDIPALQPYRKYFYRADNAEQFEVSIERALKEDSLAKQQERIQLASLHSWESRGPKIMELLLE